MKRKVIAEKYNLAFSKYASKIILPRVPAKTDPNWHIYAFRFKDHKFRPEYISFMRSKGIEVSYHYVPLHSAPYGVRLSGSKAVSLPVTEEVGRSLVRLPIYPGLKAAEVNLIINLTQKFLDGIK
jgi:dTDP-4-amino-4,6-dideoxygalactose transaminase